MKIKVLALAVVLLAGMFSQDVLAAGECGADSKGSCYYVGAMTAFRDCPDGKLPLSGGKDCPLSEKCCVNPPDPDDIDNQAGGKYFIDNLVDSDDIDNAAESAYSQMMNAVDPDDIDNAAESKYSQEYAKRQAASGQAIFTNPLKYDSVEGFLANFLNVLRQIIVVLALVFIVIGAVMYIVSAGNSSMIETAKKAIGASLIGLALGIAAPSFLKEIYSALGIKNDPNINASVNAALGDAPTLTQVALNVLNFLLSAVGILAMLMLVIGGVLYLTSAGDEDRIDMGKKIFVSSVIGIILAFSAMIIVRQIALLFA